MPQKNTTTVGRVGEYYVAYLLERYGIDCTIVDRRGADIFCRRPDGSLFSLEVKTSKTPKQYPKNSTKRSYFTFRKYADADWFAFVDLETESVIFRSKEEANIPPSGMVAISRNQFEAFDIKKALQRMKG